MCAWELYSFIWFCGPRWFINCVRSKHMSQRKKLLSRYYVLENFIVWIDKTARRKWCPLNHFKGMLNPDSKDHGANMGPTWVLSAPGRPHVQYIPRNMLTVFALLCFVVVIHWLIFPYPSGLLHWHCGNLTIAPVPAKQPWWIWINTSCEFIMNDCITTTKQSTTKLCAYFLGYTVGPMNLAIRVYTLAWFSRWWRVNTPTSFRFRPM